MALGALDVGIVCGHCDSFNPMGAAHCGYCGHDVTLLSANKPARSPSSHPGEIVGGFGARARTTLPASKVEEERMDQARYYVCESCQTPVPSGHKFCGRCGTPVPEAMMHLHADFYGDMQDPAKARLILIRGEGMDGLSYHLKADQHLLGRQGQLEFPDDQFISPKHANFFYRDNRLIVRDEGSLNGIYFRIRGSVEISPGDQFVIGEQVFRLDPTPKASDGADPDGTFFYSSPKYPSAFRLNQILEGGALGMTICARGSTLQVGSVIGDLILSGDPLVDAQHCLVEEQASSILLTDLESRNGVFVRTRGRQELVNGDEIVIGRTHLVVDIEPQH